MKGEDDSICCCVSLHLQCEYWKGATALADLQQLLWLSGGMPSSSAASYGCKTWRPSLRSVVTTCHNLFPFLYSSMIQWWSMPFNVFVYFQCSPAVWQLTKARTKDDKKYKRTQVQRPDGQTFEVKAQRVPSKSKFAGLLQHLRSSCSQELVHACRMTTPFMFDVFIYYLLLKQLWCKGSSALPVSKSANSRPSMVDRCRWCIEA